MNQNPSTTNTNRTTQRGRQIWLTTIGLLLAAACLTQATGQFVRTADAQSAAIRRSDQSAGGADSKTRVRAEDKAKAKQAKTVELVIDYGDGAQKRYPRVPWRAKLTVLDALVWAERHPHGVTTKRHGKRDLAMVHQIDDLKNGGASGQNWIYRVNGQLGDRSCGAYRVQPGDRIEWKYSRYE